MLANKKDVRKCLFCGRILHPGRVRRKGKSEEHIIPKWLMDHLEIRRLPVSPMRVHVGTRRILDVRDHYLETLTAGAVCGASNNGWMSGLEDAAKPILIRLIADPNQLTALTEQERIALSRWTFKTLAALNRSSTYGDPRNKHARSVPDSHLRLLALGRLPEDVIVVGGRSDSQRPLEWLQYAMWFAPKGVVLTETDRDRSYKIGLMLHHLVLAVAYYPSPQYRYFWVNTHHIPLWRGTKTVSLELNELADTSAPKSTSPQIELFLRNIFVVSEAVLESWGKAC
ncbi:MAG TPA: hypothetical protein VN841_02360 [Bryobacteraceae bacterium]|nr:hypothetical protein [Bryobacteraceae bacterium]